MKEASGRYLPSWEAASADTEMNSCFIMYENTETTWLKKMILAHLIPARVARWSIVG